MKADFPEQNPANSAADKMLLEVSKIYIRDFPRPVSSRNNGRQRKVTIDPFNEMRSKDYNVRSIVHSR